VSLDLDAGYDMRGWWYPHMTAAPSLPKRRIVDTYNIILTE